MKKTIKETLSLSILWFGLLNTCLSTAQAAQKQIDFGGESSSSSLVKSVGQEVMDPDLLNTTGIAKAVKEGDANFMKDFINDVFPLSYVEAYKGLTILSRNQKTIDSLMNVLENSAAIKALFNGDGQRYALFQNYIKGSRAAVDNAVNKNPFFHQFVEASQELLVTIEDVGRQFCAKLIQKYPTEAPKLLEDASPVKAIEDVKKDNFALLKDQEEKNALQTLIRIHGKKAATLNLDDFVQQAGGKERAAEVLEFGLKICDEIQTIIKKAKDGINKVKSAPVLDTSRGGLGFMDHDILTLTYGQNYPAIQNYLQIWDKAYQIKDDLMAEWRTPGGKTVKMADLNAAERLYAMAYNGDFARAYGEAPRNQDDHRQERADFKKMVQEIIEQLKK